jgi:DNA-binding MarR family transcriptional regulator
MYIHQFAMSRPTRKAGRGRAPLQIRPGDLLPLPCACANIRRLSRLVTRLYDAELRESDLEVTQFGVLSALNRLGRATHGQLARGLGMDSTTMTRVIGVLGRRGWVASESATDRRQRVYAITADGTRQLDLARPGWRRAQRRVSALLGTDTLAALASATARFGEIEFHPVA